jgi:hypothetical protein
VTNPYLELTRDFNRGRRRALVSSGQAVVLHRLAIMSKDGDWILREDDEATHHVLDVLAGRDARYRFGAPLDARWLAGGWSSHFEHWHDGLRLRTDFVTRPPRIPAADLTGVWRDADDSGRDVVGLVPLARMKMTQREKDFAVIGEIARRMPDARSQLLFSRSSRDLARLAADHPQALAETIGQRPLLARIGDGRDALEAALDRERRLLMRSDEARLAAYRAAAAAWASLWPEVARQIERLSLREAHAIVVARAEGVLPFRPSEDHDHG